MDTTLAKGVDHLKTAIVDNKREMIALVFILVLAAFLRLYKIREFAIFLGDEGRDVLVVKRMIVDGRWTLLGPTASVGGFYLGPVYYYFMIPWLWGFGFDPVGPAVMVALLGTVTVALLYWASREWFGKTSALAAALLYASAPGVVSASRSSWNPNIMPLFSLLSIFALSQACKKTRAFWFLLAGISYGIAIQSHYLGLIIGPILAAATLIALPRRQWIRSAFLEVLGFLMGGSMFVIFELRHGFPNTRSIIEFVTRGSSVTAPRSWNLVWLFYEMLRRTFEATLAWQETLVRIALFIALAAFLLYFARRWYVKSMKASLWVFVSWLLIGTMGIGIYQGQLYPHYFGFLFPVPFLLMGLPLGSLLEKQRTRVVAGMLLAIALSGNLVNQRIWGIGSNLIEQTKNVAQEVIVLAGKKPYNFALISSGNSDHAYRYFLEILGKPPKLLEDEVTQQLIVVCEDPNYPCNPLGHPLWDLAGFGRTEIAGETSVYPEIRVIRLIHHGDSKDLIGKPAPKG